MEELLLLYGFDAQKTSRVSSRFKIAKQVDFALLE